jgi:hypothetical protein
VEDNCRGENDQAPQARKKIARSFNCGFVVEKGKAPAGAAEIPGPNDSVAPAGAWFVLTFYPRLKPWAIFGCRPATTEMAWKHYTLQTSKNLKN